MLCSYACGCFHTERHAASRLVVEVALRWTDWVHWRLCYSWLEQSSHFRFLPSDEPPLEPSYCARVDPALWASLYTSAFALARDYISDISPLLSIYRSCGPFLQLSGTFTLLREARRDLDSCELLLVSEIVLEGEIGSLFTYAVLDILSARPDATAVARTSHGSII